MKLVAVRVKKEFERLKFFRDEGPATCISWYGRGRRFLIGLKTGDRQSDWFHPNLLREVCRRVQGEAQGILGTSWGQEKDAWGDSYRFIRRISTDKRACIN